MNLTVLFFSVFLPRMCGPILRLACALCLVSCVSACRTNVEPQSEAMAFVQDMGVGWNLGNTFDSLPGNKPAAAGDLSAETAWGNPRVTRKLIRFIKEQGFDTIRIPVTWGPHMGPAPDYQVDPAWMARVGDVVDWALAEKMYVVLNIHHEKGWMEPASKDFDGVMAKYQALWRQIAKHFRDHADHLLFESMNEVGFSGLDAPASAAMINRFNAAFVSLIRASGGANRTRMLVLPGHLANLDEACEYLKFPESDARCMASVHYYLPPQFAIAEPGTDWGYQYSWGTDADHAVMQANFEKLKTAFTAKGIPVILGEYGCLLRGKDRAGRIDYFRSIVSLSKENGGICPVFWDNGEELDRRAFVWRQEGVLSALLGRADY